jgi:hypothetical protein
MACGVLPAVDKQLCAFERWLGTHIGAVTDSGHAQVIRRFATWEVLPRLRARAERKPLSTGSRGYAVAQSCAPPSSSSGSPGGASPCPGAVSQLISESGAR